MAYTRGRISSPTQKYWVAAANTISNRKTNQIKDQPQNLTTKLTT